MYTLYMNFVDELILNEKRYISAKRAAEICLYAQDYVGQLCREGKIEAVRVGRNWYVEEASVVEHKQYSNIGESTHKILSTITTKVNSSPKHVKNAFAVYGNDKAPLFPTLSTVETTEKGVEIPIRIVSGGMDKKLDLNYMPQKHSHVISSMFDRVLAGAVLSAVVAVIVLTGTSMVNSDVFIGHMQSAQFVVAQVTEGVMSSDDMTAQGILHTYELVATEVYESFDAVVYSIYEHSF